MVYHRDWLVGTCAYCLPNAVNILIELVEQKYIADSATLLTIHPLEINGTDVEGRFEEYIPPKK